MKSSLALALAGLMFLSVLVLRRFHTDTATGFAVVAMLLVWLLLASPVCLKWGDAGMEQWRAIRQAGRTRFVLLYGTWWAFWLFFLMPSLDFAAGEKISLRYWWVLLLIAIVGGPISHNSEWDRRERKFLEWEKRGPMPENGVV